ncbi:hypothetical protein BT96DRAFT_1025359 [Gymnopus androsaceus JB14]|uniref:DUF6534 domain-containing protein n=1 Tax=Gymnopus androsaceus JB14 TaxID=1447944 RepID=A0A6A4GU49_9AGAR|nr:hypothetical protein BT96DRAFT_1025359 [Gymnopus androsaceus JB14]
MSGLSAVEQARINLSVGGVVVGNYFSYLTMGIVLSATWTYFSKFPADRWWFKTLVVLCVSMCICDTIATGFWSYDLAVANYANPAVLAFSHWSVPAEGFFLATCGLVVQLFYAWRLWIMSMKNNWILPLVIGFLSILSYCVGCWMIHSSIIHKLISDFILLLPVAYIWFGSSVAADVVITGSMVYYLDFRFRMNPEFPSGVSPNWAFHRNLRKLMVRTVECNLLSLFVQAITIGLFNHSTIGLYYLITDMTLAKVYTFSLLVSCTFRRALILSPSRLSSSYQISIPSVNCRHSNNGPGISNGGFSSSRGVGGIVELTVLHTSFFPSTRVSRIQREATGDSQEQTNGPVFNDNEV